MNEFHIWPFDISFKDTDIVTFSAAGKKFGVNHPLLCFLTVPFP